MSEHGPDGERSRDAVLDYEGESLLESLPAIIAVLTLGVGVTTAVLGLGQVTALVFVVGWLLLTPLSAILADTKYVQSVVGSDSTTTSREEPVGDDEAALEELKRRYARGEIDEAEFERRTAMLLENDSIHAVAERVERTDDGRSGDRHVPRDAPGGGEHAVDGNREREYET